MSRQVEALRGIPPEVPEVSRRKQKLGVHREKRKERRQSTAVDRKLESTESGVEGEKAVRRRHEGYPSNLDQADDPGRRSLHQLRPGCLEREQESGRSGVTTASPEGRRRGLSVETFGGARVACSCGASVAPRRFGSGGAADILHDRQSLRQLRAAARPLSVASSLELGAVRRVLVASLSTSGGVAAAIGSDADGVSCTVLGAGPCWRSVS